MTQQNTEPCGWISGLLAKDCWHCQRNLCHACDKPVNKSDGNVCDDCYSRMDIQQLEG